MREADERQPAINEMISLEHGGAGKDTIAGMIAFAEEHPEFDLTTPETRDVLFHLWGSVKNGWNFASSNMDMDDICALLRVDAQLPFDRKFDEMKTKLMPLEIPEATILAMFRIDDGSKNGLRISNPIPEENEGFWKDMKNLFSRRKK